MTSLGPAPELVGRGPQLERLAARLGRLSDGLRDSPSCASARAGWRTPDTVLLDCDAAGSGRLAAAALRLARRETAAAADLLHHDRGHGETGNEDAASLALLVEVELDLGEIDAATTAAAALAPTAPTRHGRRCERITTSSRPGWSTTA